MQQKKEKSQASGLQKPEKNNQDRKDFRVSNKKASRNPDNKASRSSDNKASRSSDNKASRYPDKITSRSPDKNNFHNRQGKTEGKSSSFKKGPSEGKQASSKSRGSEKGPEPVNRKRNSQRFEYEDDQIFWCKKCNLPLIGEECGRCGGRGEPLRLSQPADVRFCSPYEREVLDRQLYSAFGCNPLGERLILLNKIPGEDKTDEVLVDGFTFGILRFELSKMDYSFEPSLQGAKILLKHAEGRKVELKKTNRHLNGKSVAAESIETFDSNIKTGDFVLVTAGSLTGYGVSLVDASLFKKGLIANLFKKGLIENDVVRRDQAARLLTLTF
jgi:phosphoadenosine phosphosulfate reductase